MAPPCIAMYHSFPSGLQITSLTCTTVGSSCSCSIGSPPFPEWRQAGGCRILTCEPCLCFLTTLNVFALITLIKSFWSRHNSSEPSSFQAIYSGRAVSLTVPKQRELRASHNLQTDRRPIVQKPYEML